MIKPVRENIATIFKRNIFLKITINYHIAKLQSKRCLYHYVCFVPYKDMTCEYKKVDTNRYLKVLNQLYLTRVSQNDQTVSEDMNVIILRAATD